jgi:hypothetical protein
VATPLATLEAQLAAINTTLTTLYGKVAASYSIMQRNVLYADIEKFSRERDKLEAKIAAVSGGGSRGTTGIVTFSDERVSPDRSLS